MHKLLIHLQFTIFISVLYPPYWHWNRKDQVQYVSAQDSPARIRLYRGLHFGEFTSLDCPWGMTLERPFQFTCVCVHGIWGIYTHSFTSECFKRLTFLGGDNTCFKVPGLAASMFHPIGPPLDPFKPSLNVFNLDFKILQRVVDETGFNLGPSDNFLDINFIDKDSSFITVTRTPWTLIGGTEEIRNSLCLLPGTVADGDEWEEDQGQEDPDRIYCFFNFVHLKVARWNAEENQIPSIKQVRSGCDDSVKLRVRAEYCSRIAPPRDLTDCKMEKMEEYAMENALEGPLLVDSGRTTLNPDPDATTTENPNATMTVNPNATTTLNPNETTTFNPNETTTVNPNTTTTLNPNETTTFNPNATTTDNPNATTTANTEDGMHTESTTTSTTDLDGPDPEATTENPEQGIGTESTTTESPEDPDSETTEETGEPDGSGTESTTTMSPGSDSEETESSPGSDETTDSNGEGTEGIGTESTTTESPDPDLGATEETGEPDGSLTESTTTMSPGPDSGESTSPGFDETTDKNGEGTEGIGTESTTVESPDSGTTEETGEPDGSGTESTTTMNPGPDSGESSPPGFDETTDKNGEGTEGIGTESTTTESPGFGAGTTEEREPEGSGTESTTTMNPEGSESSPQMGEETTDKSGEGTEGFNTESTTTATAITGTASDSTSRNTEIGSETPSTTESSENGQEGSSSPDNAHITDTTKDDGSATSESTTVGHESTDSGGSGSNEEDSTTRGTEGSETDETTTFGTGSGGNSSEDVHPEITTEEGIPSGKETESTTTRRTTGETATTKRTTAKSTTKLTTTKRSTKSTTTRRSSSTTEGAGWTSPITTTPKSTTKKSTITTTQKSSYGTTQPSIISTTTEPPVTLPRPNENHTLRPEDLDGYWVVFQPKVPHNHIDSKEFELVLLKPKGKFTPFTPKPGIDNGTTTTGSSTSDSKEWIEATVPNYPPIGWETQSTTTGSTSSVRTTTYKTKPTRSTNGWSSTPETTTRKTKRTTTTSTRRTTEKEKTQSTTTQPSMSSCPTMPGTSTDATTSFTSTPETTTIGYPDPDTCENGLSREKVMDYWLSPESIECPSSLTQAIYTDQVRRFTVKRQFESIFDRRIQSLEQMAQLTNFTKEIMLKTCSEMWVPNEYFVIAWEAFRTFVEEDFFTGVGRPEASVYPRILSALRRCQDRASSHNFEYESLDCGVNKITGNLILPGKKEPLSVPEFASHKKFEVLIEIAWKTFLNAHSYCFEDFLYPNDHNHFSALMLQLFSKSIYDKWKKRLESTKLYSFLLPEIGHLEIILDNIDYCVAATGKVSKCPVWMHRTGNKPDAEEVEENEKDVERRKKRALNDNLNDWNKMWPSKALCFHTKEQVSEYRSENCPKIPLK